MVLFRNKAPNRSEWIIEVHHTVTDAQVELSRMFQVLLAVRWMGRYNLRCRL